MAWDRAEYQKKIREKALSRFSRRARVKTLNDKITKLERKLWLYKDKRALEENSIRILDMQIAKLGSAFTLFGEPYHVPSDKEIYESLIK